MQVAVFRWKAVGPLLLFGALWATAWVLFADWIARRAIETVGTAMIGAKVEVRSVALRLGHGNVAVRGLTVASPATKNPARLDTRAFPAAYATGIVSVPARAESERRAASPCPKILDQHHARM